ncbi:hypothetical protein ACTQ49_06850 [Luteococcus sp. Sow4_B9]|uniref:hypothetical protein n=1 Tax=Luteococcus sp. Sow4_B9 TaxID=3438792 RepID=UPI003F98DBCD
MKARTTGDLLAQGLTHGDLRAAVAAGDLVRLRRGAYLKETPQTDVERHRMLIDATIRGLGDVVVSHQSAAVVHGLLLPGDPGELVHVLRRRSTKGGGQKNGVVHTHVGKLHAGDIVVVDGMRVTSRARTVVDLARTMNFQDAVILLDAALRSPDRPGEESEHMRSLIQEAVGRAGRVPGVKMARDALSFADGRSGSPLESRSRILIHEEGLPPPVLQYVVADQWGHVLARLDFAWPDQKVYGECDGAVKYGALLRPGQTAAEVVMLEKRRDNSLADLGWRQVRWMDADLRRPHVLAERIRRALAGGLAVAS